MSHDHTSHHITGLAIGSSESCVVVMFVVNNGGQALLPTPPSAIGVLHQSQVQRTTQNRKKRGMATALNSCLQYSPLLYPNIPAPPAPPAVTTHSARLCR